MSSPARVHSPQRQHPSPQSNCGQEVQCGWQWIAGTSCCCWAQHPWSDWPSPYCCPLAGGTWLPAARGHGLLCLWLRGRQDRGAMWIVGGLCPEGTHRLGSVWHSLDWMDQMVHGVRVSPSLRMSVHLCSHSLLSTGLYCIPLKEAFWENTAIPTHHAATV